MADAEQAADEDSNSGQESPIVSPDKESAAAPSESQIAESHNEHARKNGERFIFRPARLYLWRPIKIVVRFLDEHDGAVTALATVAIACLTISLARDSGLQASSSDKQFGVMRDQLTEMKNQRLATIAQIRANVGYERIEPHALNSDGKFAGIGERIDKWLFNPIIKNRGVTDGLNFVVWWDVDVNPIPPLVNGQRNIGDCPFPVKPVEKIDETIVPPTHEFPLIAKDLSAEDAISASGKTPTKVILITGHMEYRDIFFPETKLHHFDWCVIAQPFDLAKNEWSFFKARDEGD